MCWTLVFKMVAKLVLHLCAEVTEQDPRPSEPYNTGRMQAVALGFLVCHLHHEDDVAIVS